MSRSIHRVAVGITLLFVALVLQLTYLQVVQADKLADDPRNVRNAIRDFSRPRGPILTAEGDLVAHSVQVGGEFEYQREYPMGSLFAHISGYQSFTLGNTGVERSYNDELIGRDTWMNIHDLASLRRTLAGEQTTGKVVLSISTAMQQLVRDALGDQQGSIVALDPRSGAVLAMYSNPTYDPSVLASHDPTEVENAFALLNAAQPNPMVSRAFQDRLPPGSTFKVVTAALGMDGGVATPDTSYPAVSSIPLPLTDRTLSNFGGSACGGILFEVFVRSCNTPFATIGLELEDRFAEGIQQFGITSAPPIDLIPGASAGSGPEPGTFSTEAPFFAYAAIGQASLYATPLHMALAAAAVANGGVMPTPHVVSEILDASDRHVRDVAPGPWRTVMAPETAAQLQAMMLAVVERGTGTGAQIPGVAVAGKTGTAESGLASPHAWFVAFAPAENPVIAVSVVLEGATIGDPDATGGRYAAPVARDVIAGYLALPGILGGVG